MEIKNETNSRGKFENIDHKQAMNDLYNKRSTSFTTNLYNQNKDQYQQRATADKTFA